MTTANIVRDPTFPDIPSFARGLRATPACETEGGHGMRG